jgi:sterol desaturase/sphingolipid hydroxylase (fatty acid hydroxylase superfamily)
MGLSAVAKFLAGNPGATQVILFGSLMLSVWVVERIVKAQSTFAKLRHTSINAAFMSGALPVQLAMMVPCAALAQWTALNHFGLVYLLPNAGSPWIKYVLMFIALDFLDYVYHYIAHQAAPIWRLHLVHHTDPAVDVSTTFREHPGETLVRICFLMAWVLLCGASLQVLILRQTVESVSNVMQHTMFRLPAGPARVLGWLFVTPNLHHTHHHCRLPGTNCNYGDVFSVWDRLFGTYVDMQAEDTVFGLDTHAGAADTGVMQLLGLGGLFAPSPLGTSE